MVPYTHDNPLETEAKKAIVLGGTSAHIPLIEQLHARGYSTVLVDYYEAPVAAAYAHAHKRFSTLDIDAVIGLARSVNAQLIISACVDQANLTACQAAEVLGLPAPYNYATALKVCDKVLMKATMQQAGIPMPAMLSMNRPGMPDKLPAPYPLIVKPADGCGSKGVRLVRNAEELRAHSALAFQSGRSQSIVLEAFKRGRELVLEAYVQKGIAQPVSVYEKFNVYGRETVVQCYCSLRPVVPDENTLQALYTIAQQIATAFGLVNTPLFIQTIADEDGVHVLEFGARAAGGLATRATLAATGFDAVEATINSYLGIPVVVPEQPKNGKLYSTNSIYAAPGIFDRVSGHHELLEKGIIREFVTYKSKGMPIYADMSSSERIAGFLVEADSMDELLEKTGHALSSLQIWNAEQEEIMLRKPFYKVHAAHLHLD
jgi:biotin carboxylase